MSRDLVHRRTRNAFRETCSDFGVVRQIETAFENEGLDPASDDGAPSGGWYSPGQRRGTFDRHTHSLDWSNPSDVSRVLPVFEEILRWTDNEQGVRANEQLRRHLERDGFSVDAEGRIRASVTASLEDLPLGELRDATAIMEHLNRLTAATDRDPPLAISGAKALIEATTKKVLEELGERYDERADVPALVKAAQKALQLHPEAIAPTTKGVESIKKVLSSLAGIAVGIAELRNEYGPDHGRTRPTVGLGRRHAHLAVGAASTYCRMLLETLGERRVSATRTAPQ